MAQKDSLQPLAEAMFAAATGAFSTLAGSGATAGASTMESAARSGHLAAEAVCTAIGEPQKFLVADLKPRGLMRFVKTAAS